jgi:preprotein translocase subunit SecD
VTFRPVLWDATAGVLPTAADASEARAEADLTALNCAQHGTAPAAAESAYLAACSEDGKGKYLLGPSALSGRHVHDAKSAAGSGRWQVQVTFDAVGGQQLAAVTSSLAGTGKPLAIAVGGTVVSAPSVEAPIGDGRLQISGAFDRTTADQLAAVLTLGASG